MKTGLSIGRRQRAVGNLKRLEKKGKYIYWEIILSEGKNREIRRIFKKLDSEIIELHRYEFAGLNVNNIKIGHYIKVDPKIFK